MNQSIKDLNSANVSGLKICLRPRPRTLHRQRFLPLHPAVQRGAPVALARPAPSPYGSLQLSVISTVLSLKHATGVLKRAATGRDGPPSVPRFSHPAGSRDEARSYTCFRGRGRIPGPPQSRFGGRNRGAPLRFTRPYDRREVFVFITVLPLHPKTARLRVAATAGRRLRYALPHIPPRHLWRGG